MRTELKKEVNVEKLIKRFEGMAERESLLARGSVSQQDLLMQIIGTIVVEAMEEQPQNHRFVDGFWK